jgi:hypothetical protein
LQKVVSEIPHDTVEMGEVEFCAQFLTMMYLVVIRMESRVNFVDWWCFVLMLPEDRASLDIIQENIELVGLVGKPPIVKKHIQAFLPPNLSGYPNRFSRWCFRCKYGRRVGIRQ